MRLTPTQTRALLFLGVVLAAIGIAWTAWALRPRLTEEQVETAVITTLAEESPASFLITGTLTFSANIESRNTKTLLPGLLDLDLGTTEARVRVPARVSYGFDIQRIDASAIKLKDNVVEIDVPALTVFSVEPKLEEAEIETDVGWARLYRSSGRRTEQAAIRQIRPALQETAERHLARSSSPQLNTTRALAALFTPSLQAVGLEHPRFRFHVGDGVVLELDGREL